MKTYTKSIIQKAFWVVLIFSLGLSAQRRGDNLSFQGLSTPDDAGVKLLAMGNAATAISGDINALFHNPAGLVGVSEIQFSFSGVSYNRSWQENQRYRPNRIYVTLPFYLEGLYTPNPAYNGIWDYELAGTPGLDSIDYEVRAPETGLDPYSDEAADWQRDLSGSAFTNFTAAIPFTFMKRPVVVAAAYSRNVLTADFDRNDTFLDPHIGYNLYGNPSRATTVDTVTVNWSRYLRQRDGDVTNLNGAVAFQLNDNLMLGAGVKIRSADTDDLQTLDRVGYFDLVGNNKFRFSYDTLSTSTVGASEFSSSAFDIGAVLKLERLNIGVKLALPHTLSRDWNTTTTVTAIDSGITSSSSESASGTDEIELPATYQFGISVTPMDKFTFSLALDYAQYSKADYNLTSQPLDSLFQGWADYQAMRFGIEYRATNYLSLLAGYRNLPATFVPDGAAFKDRGPAANSYTFGATLAVGKLGRIDAAYEIRNLEYYDSYYSNTNYARESLNNFYLGYLYSF